MISELISIKNIKSLYSATTYRRGMSYYQQGFVKDIEYKPVLDQWSAHVAGSKLYEVEIRFEGDYIDSYCDCPAWETFGECKHEVAVLLEINQNARRNEDPSENANKKQIDMTNRFIDFFSNYQQHSLGPSQNTLKRPLHVEFYMTVMHYRYSGHELLLALEMKVGIDRTYVVRSISEFLQKVAHQLPHEFTKNFIYDPQEHYFRKEDNEIILMLQEIIENQKFYDESRSYWQSSSSSNDRYLFIPPLLAAPILTKLIDRDFTFEDNGCKFRHIDFSQEHQLPISFQLNKSDSGEFQLDFNLLREVLFLEKYGMVFYHGVFYKPPLEQMLILKEIIKFNNFDDGAPLPINHSQIGSFLSNVLPGLKTIGKVDIAEKISNQIIQPALQPKIYIDDIDDRIVLKVEYHYDHFVLNPFENQEQNIEENGVILLRDSEKEQKIMSIIEYSPLKYNGKQLYIENEDESLYDFIYRIMPQLEELSEIYLSGGIQSYFQSTTYTPVTSVDVESSGNLLEVNFDIEGIDKREIGNVLKSIVEKKRYYRLPDGSFISLESEEFDNVQQLFREFNLSEKQLQHQRVQIPIYRGLQIDDIMKTGNKYSTKLGKAYRKLIQHLKNPEEIDFELPATLNANLREYQVTGFQWFKALSYYQLGGILADDMGLGKTVQSISYILSESRSQSKNKPFLIVAPASLIYNWKSEFDKFAPNIHVEVISGTPTERMEFFKSNESPDVLITSYPTLRQDSDHYKEMEFDTMILDEAQAIKNFATKTSAAVRGINTGKRFALSGTPIENSIDELWAIFQTILPGFFPAQQEFRKLSQEKIAQMIRPFILRRVKKDVLKELPEKIETNHMSELTKQQKELYLAYLEKIQKETVQSLAEDGFNKNRIKILAGLTRLRQLCCHPSLFIDNFRGESGKLEQLIEITKTAIENGKRLLIFSQFASMLQMIRERFQKEGISCFYLDGQTPSKERVEMAERFNEGENNTFLISLKAGGTGLNLTGADTVILFDLWWNPAVEEQAAGRAHRIGQKNVVQVIRLIARGTIEEKIYELQQKKKELIEQVIQPGETMLNSLSENEIRGLLSI